MDLAKKTVFSNGGKAYIEFWTEFFLVWLYVKRFVFKSSAEYNFFYDESYVEG